MNEQHHRAASLRRAGAPRRGAVVAVVVAIVASLATSLASAPPSAAFGSSTPQPGPPSVNAGGYMTCGVRADKIAACWGANVGQTPSPTEGPGQATPPADIEFVEVNAGYSHACGVKTDSTLACWGSNYNLASVPPAGTFTHVAPGYVFGCALRSDSTAACWGTDDAGQVSTTPGGQFTHLTAGIRHACGLRADRTVRCWGSNAYGQTAAPSGTFSTLNSGNFDVCALRHAPETAAHGTALCWGRNFGVPIDERFVTPGDTFTQVSVGFQHACGLRPDNTLSCWGANAYGQASPPAGTFNNVSTGTFHSCGMRTDNAAVCWGDNAQGRVRPTVLSPAPAGTAAVGTPYAHQFAAQYMSPAPTWTVVSGLLPPGLSLSSAGTITGTPTQVGTFADITVGGTNGLSPASTQTFTIVVSGPASPPGAPTGVRATAGNASATVTWTAPSDGGSRITSYTVTASPGGTVTSVDGSSTTATVSGLTNGVTYTFTVKATNSAGTGPESEPSNSVTPTTVPGAPTGVTATAANASAKVSWKVPSDNGGSPITSFTVIASPGGATTTVSGSATTATVTGLTNGTSYRFTVSATNAVGTGPASEPSNAVTPTKKKK